MTERSVIVLGRPGVGKSSTANSIAGSKDIFRVEDYSPSSVTRCPEVRQSAQPQKGRMYKTCDNPGMLDNDVGLVKRALQIQNSLELCPKPHAFLIVFSITSRITHEDKCTINLLELMFGKVVFNHCIIVFTNGDKIADKDAFERFYEKSSLIVDLKKRCGNRIVKIENKFDTTSGAPIGNGMDELLGLIEEVSKNGDLVYQNKCLFLHKKALEKHLEPIEETSENIQERLDKITSTLETYVRYFKNGVKIGSTVVGVVGVGGLAVANGGAVVAMAKGGGVAAAGGIKVAGGKVAAAVVANVGPTINVAMKLAFKTT